MGSTTYLRVAGSSVRNIIAPVFIDDTIQAHSEIVAKREHTKNPENYGFIDENVVVTNQEGNTVMAFTHIYLVDKK